MTARAYKNEVGLRQSTALLSEALREKLVLNGVDKRIQNLIPGGKKTQEEKDKVRATLKKTTMEDKNRRGTCPAQLLDRLYKKFQKYGRMPTHKELGEGLADTIVATYGTMKEACRLAEVPYRKPGENVVDPVAEKKVIPSKAPIEYDRDMLLRLLRVFKDTHNREPYRSDLKRGLLPDRSVFDRYFESFKEAKEIAFRDYSI
jgi:hypothetical protein